MRSFSEEMANLVNDAARMEEAAKKIISEVGATVLEEAGDRAVDLILAAARGVAERNRSWVVGQLSTPGCQIPPSEADAIVGSWALDVTLLAIKQVSPLMAAAAQEVEYARALLRGREAARTAPCCAEGARVLATVATVLGDEHPVSYACPAHGMQAAPVTPSSPARNEPEAVRERRQKMTTMLHRIRGVVQERAGGPLHWDAAHDLSGDLAEEMLGNVMDKATDRGVPEGDARAVVASVAGVVTMVLCDAIGIDDAASAILVSSKHLGILRARREGRSRPQ